MMNQSRQCDPYVLETIIDKYRKRNKALEQRESAIIQILANIDREKTNTSEIEEKIKIAISDSKKFENEDLRPGRWAKYRKSGNNDANNSTYYPRLSGRSDSYKPLPLESTYESSSSTLKMHNRELGIDDKEFTSWRRFPQEDVDIRSENEADCLDMDENQLADPYGGVFLADSNKHFVREMSPERGVTRLGRDMQDQNSDSDVEKNFVREMSSERGAARLGRDMRDQNSDSDVERMPLTDSKKNFVREMSSERGAARLGRDMRDQNSDSDVERMFLTDSKKHFVREMSSERGAAHLGWDMRDQNSDSDVERMLLTDSKKHFVREMSPERGVAFLGRDMWNQKSDPDVEKHFVPEMSPKRGAASLDRDMEAQVSDPDEEIPFEDTDLLTDLNLKRSPNEPLSDYVRNLVSPSIQDMIQSYERRHTPFFGDADYDKQSDTKDVLEEDRRPTSHQEKRSLLSVRELSRRRSVVTASTSQSSCSPFSDSERNSSQDTLRSSKLQRTKADQKNNRLDSMKTSRSKHASTSDTEQIVHSQQPPNHNYLYDSDSEQYEFDENYSSNYLQFLIRECLPKSLLRSEYNGSYTWSSENKQDIFNKIEEVQLIKKIVCDELDYRELINRPFKIHRDDRRFLLRNIMYADAVQLGLSKGLPICGVMALFAEMGSTENIKQLTLQTIRQAYEILGESHPDPVGPEDIVSVAEECINKLTQLNQRTVVSNSSKLGKILLDVISREPILDPRENLSKCVDELSRHADIQAFVDDEVDSLTSEACRLKKIMWSIEEYTALKSRREQPDRPFQRQMFFNPEGKKSQHALVAGAKRDAPTEEQARFTRATKRMKERIHHLEHEAIPHALGKKKDIEHVCARKKTTTSCVKNNKTHVTVKTKRCNNTHTSSCLKNNTANDDIKKEHELLKSEVQRLKSVVDHMERRLGEQGSESEAGQSNTTKKVPMENNASQSNCVSQTPEKVPKKNSASQPNCVSQTAEKVPMKNNASEPNCISQTIEKIPKKNIASKSNCVHQSGGSVQTRSHCTNIHKKVFYLVANKEGNVPEGVSHCIRRHPKNEPIGTTVHNCDAAGEQQKTASKQQEDTNTLDTLNLTVIPETSDVFLSALSIPTKTPDCGPSRAEGQANETTAVTGGDKTNVDTKASETTSKPKNTNPLASMWENMVDALIPSIAQKRRVYVADAAPAVVVSDETTSTSSLPQEGSHKVSDETMFKIHTHGSAYEISSAFNESPTMPDKEYKQDIEDLSKNLALAVKMPEATEQSLKEAFKESYVATCEKAINEALKDIINSYPNSNSFDVKVGDNAKKRSTIQINDTTLSDCSSQYTKDDIVIVGTTNTRDYRNFANDPSFAALLDTRTNCSRKKKRALDTMRKEEIVNVSYEPSNASLFNSDNGREKQSTTTMMEQEYTNNLRKPATSMSSGVAKPKYQVPTRGIASNKSEPRYTPKMKSGKVSWATAGRGTGNRSETNNGLNTFKKKNIPPASGKASKTRPLSRPGKEANKMPVGDRDAKESNFVRKNIKAVSHGNRDELYKKEQTDTYNVNAEVSVLFDGADRMEAKDSDVVEDAAGIFDIVEAHGGDRSTYNARKMDCDSALKAVSRFRVGVEYKQAMAHVKACASCTKKLLPTIFQIVNKVEDMTKKCGNALTRKTDALKPIQEQEKKRPRGALSVRGNTR